MARRREKATAIEGSPENGEGEHKGRKTRARHEAMARPKSRRTRASARNAEDSCNDESMSAFAAVAGASTHLVEDALAAVADTAERSFVAAENSIAKTSEAVARGAKKLLYSFDELPAFLQDNEFIRTGLVLERLYSVSGLISFLVIVLSTAPVNAG